MVFVRFLHRRTNKLRITAEVAGLGPRAISRIDESEAIPREISSRSARVSASRERRRAMRAMPPTWQQQLANGGMWPAISASNFMLPCRPLLIFRPRLGTLFRLLHASVLVLILHERTDFYRRFAGGFARRACSQERTRRPVRCMRILQTA